MDAKQAVSRARAYLVDLFAGEGISEVGLEEVDFDTMRNEWRITLGFSRPWDRRARLGPALAGRPSPRSYKVICIHDPDGKIKSLTDRVLPASSG